MTGQVTHSAGISRNDMNPAFSMELWTPANFPAMTAKIHHSVWDSDTLGENDIVASFTTDIKVCAVNRTLSILS